MVDAIPSSGVTMESAKVTALKMAGLTSENVRWGKVKQDYEDGRLVYEGEFYYKRKTAAGTRTRHISVATALSIRKKHIITIFISMSGRAEKQALFVFPFPQTNSYSDK